jgi:hypothetical protein
MHLTTGIAFFLFGVVIIGFAERLSRLERRMVQRFPGTRVTGWSGTRKGTISWRGVGLLFVILGLVDEVLPRLLAR